MTAQLPRDLDLGSLGMLAPTPTPTVRAVYDRAILIRAVIDRPYRFGRS